MSDERWREAFAAHREELAGEEHPSAETLWALATGELVAPESRPVVDHVSRCAACAEDLRVTRQLVNEAGDQRSVPEPEKVSEARTVALGWTRGLAAAAALMLAVSGWYWTSRDGGATMRQGGADLEVRSLLADDAVLTPGDAVLRWALPEDLSAELAGGARYDVVVTTEDLMPVAEFRGLDAAELRLRPENLSRVPDGAVLNWRVEAVLPDGTRVSSPVFRIRLSGTGSR